MKLHTTIIRTLICSSLLAVAVASAQAKPARREQLANSPAGERPHPAAQMARERLRHLARDLHLSPEQKASLREHVRSQASKRQSLRDASPAERRETVRELRQAMDQKLQKVLTYEQYRKLQAERAGGGGERPMRPGAARRPAAR